MIYTFGHSTLTSADAFGQLRDAGVQVLIDIRSHPGSTRHPQWNRPRIEAYAREHHEEFGVDYRWWPALGGLRDQHKAQAAELARRGVDVAAYAHHHFPKQRIGKDRPTAPLFDGADNGPTWTNQGLWDYQWFMTLPEFLTGADKLVEIGGRLPVAIMCAELLWWKCHRSMVADYLIWRQVPAFHLQPRFTAHPDDRLDRYHPDVVGTWERWGEGMMV